MQGEQVAADRKSVWPVVLGIITGVFGFAGFFNNLLGALAPMFMQGFVSSMTGELSGEAEETVRMTMEITQAWSAWTMGLGLIGMVLSGMLLVGGILLLLRRPAAVPLLRVWAVFRMLVVIVAAYIGLQVQRQIFAALRETMGAEMDHVPAGLLGATATFGTIFSVAFGWALPVIVLIWFAREAIKDEVDGWQ